MDESELQGERFEIDESKFECVVCETMIDFEFKPEEQGGKKKREEVPEEFEEEFEEKISTPENFADEVGEGHEGEAEEESMKINCECGAEYLIKKVPGVPGFEVVHLTESEPELMEKEFEV